ncbi:restriction endonuclease subunit S [Fibrobacter sp. UBA3629]|uniref:restriction endonuclease subunit S n=1 Tax=Fibrobacter sp. UBA3629 TaxID=1946530 RepID=UPI0025C0A27A|nr:restriction endonuclease subunit S [Fibrobacter sp. UBA3629]
MKETKFKQTEVGLIPSDWEVKFLSEIGSFSKGSGISRSESNSGNLPAIRYGELYTKHNDYIKAFYSHISKEVANKSTRIYRGDVLFSASGETKEDIGKTVAFLESIEAYAGGDIIIMSPKCPVNSMFLGYILNFPAIAKQKAMKAQGDAVVHITTDSLRKLQVCIPKTTKEQQRIANALSDVDTLIANLEKLIAKKKNIKQGAMQQLLTGRKRLPGFGLDERTGSRPTDERRKECHSERSAKREESSGYKMTELGLIPIDWEVKPIKELGLFLGGGTPSTKNESFWKGTIPWISSADLNDDDIEHISMTRFITQEAVNFSATQICPQGTILIIARVGVGKLALSQQKVCTSQDFCNLIPSKENDSKFLAYALHPVMKRMSNESQGTSIKGVAVDEIKKVQIIVPSSKDEQTAIANVLSDMDTEISALETKLAKYRTLKTGMMQQLLTGKIRLV